MTELSILKKQVQLFSDKIEELIALKGDELKKVSQTHSGDKCIEEIKKIERNYEEARIDLKSKSEEVLRETLEALRTVLKGKPTSEANSESMSDITLLQLLGTITEEQLILYTDKYKDYPMILKYLKQIGEKNGYHVSFKSIDDAKNIIDKLEMDTKDFLKNYDSKSDNHKHRLMKTELEANYFDIVGKDLEGLIGNNKVTILKNPVNY